MPVKPTRFSASLQKFSDQIDEHLGEAVGYAEAVRGLWVVRQQIRPVEKVNEACTAPIRARLASGGVELPLHTSDGARYRAKWSKPTRVETYRAVDAERIKRHSTRLWQEAQVIGPRVAITAPKFSAPVVPARPRVPMPVPGAPSYALLDRHLQVREVLKGLRGEEAVLIERLRAIGGRADWDGLPVAFSDGWAVSLRDSKYSSDRLAEIAPDVFDRLAVEKQRGGVSRLIIRLEREEDREGDEEDAD